MKYDIGKRMISSLFTKCFKPETDRNAEQLQRWEAVRSKGRRAYLVKRTLLWGTIWSVVVIFQSELRSRVYANRMAEMTMAAIFGKDWNSSPENPLKDFITSNIGQAIDCFLLAGFIALAIWTYKEQLYTQIAGANHLLNTSER